MRSDLDTLANRGPANPEAGGEPSAEQARALLNKLSSYFVPSYNNGGDEVIPNPNQSRQLRVVFELPERIVVYSRGATTPQFEFLLKELDPKHVRFLKSKETLYAPMVILNETVTRGFDLPFGIDTTAAKAYAEATRVLIRSAQTPVDPKVVKPNVPEKLAPLVQALQSALGSQQKSPRFTGAVTILSGLPAPVRPYYAGQSAAYESGNVTAYLSTLAPDFYSKSIDGIVTPRSRFKQKLESEFAAAGSRKVRLLPESVENAGTETIVTLQRVVSGPSGTTSEHVRETWVLIEGQPRLQSTEPFTATVKPPPGSAGAPARSSVLFIAHTSRSHPGRPATTG